MIWRSPSLEKLNKQSLKVFHLSRQKRPKSFHHQSPQRSLSIHIKTDGGKKKKENDSWIIAAHKRRLKARSVSSTERKMSESFQRTLVGRTKWKPSFMRWGGGGGRRGHSVCTLQHVDGLCAPLKCHPRRPCNTPTRSWSCSLYFRRVIIYVPAMNFHSGSPCTKTSHFSPRNQMEQGRATAKSSRLQRFFPVLSYEFSICCAKLYLWI